MPITRAYKTSGILGGATTNGETLVADSSTSTGLRWTGANQQNPVINGAFDVWQRGTSFAIPAAYTFTADRFEAIRNAGALGMTVSRQVTNDTTNLPQIRYACRIARDSGNTSTAPMYFDHSIETADSIRYAGQTITISIYARVGANYSPTSNAFKIKGVNGTGTDQAIKNYTGANLFINSTINPTTTWARYSVTGTVPTNSTEIGIEFEITPTGTAGANDWIEITGIQIDLGSVALPYRRYSATLAGELAACQRYFQLISGDAEVLGAFYTTTNAVFSYKCPVEMRVAPTPTYNTTYTNAVDQVGVANRTPTGYSSSYVGKSGITFFATGMATSTIYNPAIYRGGNHLLSAEL